MSTITDCSSVFFNVCSHLLLLMTVYKCLSLFIPSKSQFRLWWYVFKNDKDTNLVCNLSIFCTLLMYCNVRQTDIFHTNIILWYYFTFWKEDPPHVDPPLLSQNLGAKTIWVDLTLKTTPPPLILYPIHLGGSALFLY